MTLSLSGVPTDAVVDALAAGASYLIILVLAVWAAATLLRVNDDMEDFLANHLGEAVRFVPNFHFFSPHPGQFDYHLLYRDKLEDGSLTAWREVTELTDLPRNVYWLWNPNLHDAKTLFDHANHLTGEVARPGDEVDLDDADGPAAEASADAADGDAADGADDHPAYLEPIKVQYHTLSVQYLTLLNYVTGLEHHEDCEKTQFMLMRSSRRIEDHQPLFVSNQHEVPR